MAQYPARQIYFSQRNIEFAYVKNMPLGLILRYLPQRILYEVGAAIYFTRMGVGKAFLQAKLDVLRQLPTLLSKRREIQKHRSISNAQLHAKLCGNRLRARWQKFWSAWGAPSTTPVQNSQAAH
jgi:hypothetical protein